MMPDDTQRIVLLNRLVSRSATRARNHQPPTHSGVELLEIIGQRSRRGWAFEIVGSPDEYETDETKRAAKAIGHSLLRVRRFKLAQSSDGKYQFATLLLEYVDEAVRSFPVVDTRTFTGREIEGKADERGATAAHMVVRLPTDGYDDGSYRCAIEAVSPITRYEIERLLCRQLRRHCLASGGWSFSVTITKKRKKPETKEYEYTPRLELFADVGRRLNADSSGRVLSHMVFTKRSERQAIGQPTEVLHDDIVADVEIKVSAKQGPEDPGERMAWAQAVRRLYEQRGYEARLYYRHVGGINVSGHVHHTVAGAADLLMCSREIISLDKPPKRWRPKIDADTVDRMTALLNNDALWERAG